MILLLLLPSPLIIIRMELPESLDELKQKFEQDGYLVFPRKY